MQKKDSVKKGPGREPEIGILQWFHIGDYERVEQMLSDLDKLNITHLRTGISWADWHTPEGREWYDWLMPKLGHLELLPCFLYTPPSIGIAPKTSSPPKGPKKFADFIDVFISRYGNYFDWVELWNEPNNTSEYDFTLDSNWDIFSEMITSAAYWAKKLGKKVVLGGMSPIDPNWLDFMAQRGVLRDIDAVGIHGFPGTFDQEIEKWATVINQVRKVLDYHRLDKEIWITEAGFSTWQHDQKKQVQEFIKILDAPAERVYWYSLFDIPMERPTVDGFHLDEREYYFGMRHADGSPKLLFRLLELYGTDNIATVDWIRKCIIKEKKQPKWDKYVLITGGCGFVGINMAEFLLKKGKNVLLFDNLSRPGVERNLEWILTLSTQAQVYVEIGDVRNYFQVASAAQNAEAVYHFAAQVAVTTSLEDPLSDFEINARGTFNVLEAVRHTCHKPPVFFTSTNKVYGSLPDLEFEHNNSRYFPVDHAVKQNGIDENQRLEFHSPYGSSKGAAEQYVLDYARSYGIRTTVFRMSCIYGPHQFGTEDQGWVAHFIINAIRKKPLTIYGDGMQVRDILFVTDLLEAFWLVFQNSDRLAGEVFNIGGGAKNATSLKELIILLEEIMSQKIKLKHSEPRVGDQVYYVSNTRKFQEATDWSPKTGVQKGVEKLYRWLWTEHAPEEEIQKLTQPKTIHND